MPPRPLLPFALALLVHAAPAQGFVIGKAAPALQIAEWVKGDKVTAYDAGRIYVIEFWATWSGPCLASISHLTRLQAKWRDKGVTIIGIGSADPHNSLAAVKELVAVKGEAMAYTVAWDDGTKTKDAFMTAAGKSSIPCAFVVDGRGNLAFSGHPMLLDMPIAGLVDGTWDPVQGQARLDSALRRLNDIPRDIATDTEASNARVRGFTAEFPMFAERVRTMEFQQHLAAKRFDRAYAIGAELVDAAMAAKDPEALNEIAWAIVDPAAAIERRDLDLALRAASKAVELTQEGSGNLLDTLARTWFWKGDYRQALALQKKAIARGDNPDFSKTAATYQQLVDRTPAK